MRMPPPAALAAMLAAAVTGLIAGMLTLHLLGQPTPFGRS